MPKLGSLKLAESLPKVERPDLVTLSRDAAGRYHVSFCAQVQTSLLPITHRVVGIDLGLKDLATLSTGEKIPNPKRYRARLRYLRQQQRCLARRQKGSRRREKQRLRVARAHARARQERQAALHSLTTRLVREFDLICIEDLNVMGLGRGIHARAVHDAPSIPLTYAAWGQALLERGEPDAAITQFTVANQKGPHFADPLEMWGEALMKQNRSNRALAKFIEAEKYAPNWGRLHLKWGEALGFAERKDEAQKQFALAAELELSAAEKSELSRVKQ